MSTWRSGNFEREKVATLFRGFAPARAADTLESIDLEVLQSQGKRLILLDVDNTLVEWKQENFSQAVLDWIEEAKRKDFKICIISNTRRVQRLGRIKEFLGVETVRGRFKPSRVMFRLALIKFGCKREQAVMIGDQMMTDIFGANRAGIDAIWVRQIAKKEFGPTKINRFIEGLLTSAVYKALVLPEDMGAKELSVQSRQELKLVQQISRFVIIGASCFVIDFSITAILNKFFGEQFGGWLLLQMPSLFFWAKSNDKAAVGVFSVIAAIVATYNSYVWNRAWTFEAKGKSPKARQISRVYLVAFVGSGINILIFTFLYNLFPGKPLFLAKVISASVAAVWNFAGQRQFAFKESESYLENHR